MAESAAQPAPQEAEIDPKRNATLAALQRAIESLFDRQRLAGNGTFTTALSATGAVPLGILLQQEQIREMMHGEPDATILVEALRSSKLVQVTEDGVRPRVARSTIIARELPTEVTEAQVRELFADWADSVIDVRQDLGLWYIKLSSEDEAREAFKQLQNKPLAFLEGSPVLKLRIKSEAGQPFVGQGPGSLAGGSGLPPQQGAGFGGVHGSLNINTLQPGGGPPPPDARTPPPAGPMPGFLGPPGAGYPIIGIMNGGIPYGLHSMGPMGPPGARGPPFAMPPPPPQQGRAAYPQMNGPRPYPATARPPRGIRQPPTPPPGGPYGMPLSPANGGQQFQYPQPHHVQQGIGGAVLHNGRGIDRKQFSQTPPPPATGGMAGHQQGGGEKGAGGGGRQQQHQQQQQQPAPASADGREAQPQGQTRKGQSNAGGYGKPQDKAQYRKEGGKGKKTSAGHSQDQLHHEQHHNHEADAGVGNGGGGEAHVRAGGEAGGGADSKRGGSDDATGERREKAGKEKEKGAKDTAGPSAAAPPADIHNVAHFPPLSSPTAGAGASSAAGSADAGAWAVPFQASAASEQPSASGAGKDSERGGLKPDLRVDAADGEGEGAGGGEKRESGKGAGSSAGAGPSRSSPRPAGGGVKGKEEASRSPGRGKAGRGATPTTPTQAGGGSTNSVGGAAGKGSAPTSPKPAGHDDPQLEAVAPTPVVAQPGAWARIVLKNVQQVNPNVPARLPLRTPPVPSATPPASVGPTTPTTGSGGGAGGNPQAWSAASTSTNSASSAGEAVAGSGGGAGAAKADVTEGRKKGSPTQEKKGIEGKKTAGKEGEASRGGSKAAHTDTGDRSGATPSSSAAPATPANGGTTTKDARTGTAQSSSAASSAHAPQAVHASGVSSPKGVGESGKATGSAGGSQGKGGAAGVSGSRAEHHNQQQPQPQPQAPVRASTPEGVKGPWSRSFVDVVKAPAAPAEARRSSVGLGDKKDGEGNGGEDAT